MTNTSKISVTDLRDIYQGITMKLNSAAGDIPDNETRFTAIKATNSILGKLQDPNLDAAKLEDVRGDLNNILDLAYGLDSTRTSALFGGNDPRQEVYLCEKTSDTIGSGLVNTPNTPSKKDKNKGVGDQISGVFEDENGNIDMKKAGFGAALLAVIWGMYNKNDVGSSLGFALIVGILAMVASNMWGNQRQQSESRRDPDGTEIRKAIPAEQGDGIDPRHINDFTKGTPQYHRDIPRT